MDLARSASEPAGHAGIAARNKHKDFLGKGIEGATVFDPTIEDVSLSDLKVNEFLSISKLSPLTFMALLSLIFLLTWTGLPRELPSGVLLPLAVLDVDFS